MWWNKCKHSVCETCGVFYETRTGYRGKCSVHGETERRRDQRQAAVVAWAHENWERIEGQMIDERKKAQESYNQLYRASQNAAVNMASYAAQQGMQGIGNNITGRVGNL